MQDAVEVADDPQVVANGYPQDARTKDGTPWWRRPSSSTSTPPCRAGRRSSTSTGDDILTGLLGMDWDSVIDLKLKGTVG